MKWFLVYFLVVLIDIQVQNARALTKKAPSKAPSGQGNGTMLDDNEVNVTMSQNENSCSAGESYIIIDTFSSCCATNVTLTHGMEFGKYWKECAVPLKKSKFIKDEEIKRETYVNSTRRVYSCILSKYLKKERITLLTFTNLMTVNYPTDIKNRILKDSKSHGLANEGVSLTDYTRVRQIRITYFEIQKNVCISIDGNSKSKEYENTTDPMPSKNKSRMCDQSEEADLVGGSCCRNESVPIDLDFWRSRPLKPNQCNETMAQEFKKWNVEYNDLDIASEICSEACLLKEEGVINYQDLTSDRILKKLSQDVIHQEMKRIAPQYLSQSMLDAIGRYSKKHFNLTIAETEISKHHHLSKEKTATFRSCIFFQRIIDVIYDALHSHCFPTEAESDHYIQQFKGYY